MKDRKLLTDSIWSIGSHIISLIIVLICNIILARLLMPSEFGQLAIAMFFISIFNVFTDGGMTAALVRKKDINEDDYSTVFTFNFIVSLLLFVLLVSISGFLAIFYQIESLQTTIIFASSILIISSFQTIQNAKFLQQLEFKKRSIITLISNISGVLVGLILAFKFNFGVTALISIPITTVIAQTILYNYYQGFYFKLKFNKKSFKDLIGFGINTTFVSVLNIGFDNIYQLIIGRVFNIHQAGYFYQAKKLQDVPNNIVNSISQSVFYSTLSKIQEEKEEFLYAYQLISRAFLSIMGITVLIVLFFGDDIIHLILGDKWIESVYYIKLLILGSFFYTQELINKMIFKIFNKTDVLLKLEILKKSIQFTTLLIGVYLKSLDVLMYGYILTSIFSYFLNYYKTNKIINIGNNEMVALIKICSVVIVLFIINLFTNQSDHNSWILPLILILIYLLALPVFKVINLKNLKVIGALKNKAQRNI